MMEQETGRGETPVRGVLFDFGGVLAEEGFREGLLAIGRRCGRDPEAVFHEGTEAVYDAGYVTGTGSEEDFWARFRRGCDPPETDDELTEEILLRFLLRPRMLRMVRELRRRGYLTAILSDQTDWLDRLEARDGFFHFFDRVFNSYHMGKGKRDPSVFAEIAAQLGLGRGQLLFIDDNPGNVERARAMGLQAVLFTDQPSCLAELEKLPVIAGDPT